VQPVIALSRACVLTGSRRRHLILGIQGNQVNHAQQTTPFDGIEEDHVVRGRVEQRLMRLRSLGTCASSPTAKTNASHEVSNTPMMSNLRR
jgi:hypothetical protein